MKKKVTYKTSIHKISIFPFGMINAFLLVNAKGCILIDTGLPETENKVGKVLKQLNLKFTDIKLIVITHAHIDHAGNAAKLKFLSGAPVIAHKGDLPYFMGEKKMHFCSTGWFGRFFSKTGAIQKPYKSFEPDILLTSKDEFNLNSYGFNGEVISTPGHTEGSISVIIENTKAVVGDLISSGILLGGIIRTSKAKRPPFEDSPLKVSKELQSISDKGVKIFFLGHGGPLLQKEVLLHIEKLNNVANKAG
jgi:glyoxylase-like metal-dependent hydrolase (beta-lactamase superfamily II)